MKKILYFLFSILLFIGCKDSELDVNPSSHLGSGVVINSIDDLDAAVLGVYNQMTVKVYYDGVFLTAGDMLGDDALVPYPGSGHLGSYFDYSWTKISCPTAFYKHIYSLVANINDVLERSKNLADSEAKTKLIAEIKALRAIAHFDLSKLYGPLPINLGKGKIKADALCIPIMDGIKPIKEVESMLRQPVRVVYDFITKELESALPSLNKGKINGRIGQDGVMAALARIYLYMGKNDLAFKYADSIIKNSAYSLTKKAEYVANWKKAYTSEAIFELDITSDDNNGINSIGYFVLAQGTQGYKDISSSPRFDELREKDPNDERFKLFVWYEDNKGSGYFPTLKYPGRETYAVNNIKVYRLSEIYLIAAETQLKLGKNAEAAKLLNTLRKERTTTDPEKYTAALTIDDILYERRLELFAEGHRAWDLWRNQKPIVRWENADEKDKYKYRTDKSEGVIEFDYYKNILPIHEEQLFLLPDNLRGQQQNPEYNK